MDEPAAEPVNGDQPATQHDLSMLAGEMTDRFEAVDKRFDRLEARIDSVESRMDNLEARMDNLEARMDSLEKTLRSVLEIVTGIDQQLKEWHDLPAKVERLHNRVFG